MKTASVSGMPLKGSADRVGLFLLGCLMALPLLPEFMVGYLLIGWVIWRIHQGNLWELKNHIPWSFALVIPYFLWYLWRWSATGWSAEGGRIFIMHLQWLLIPMLLLGLPQDLMKGARKLVHVLWVLVVLTALALFVQGIIELLMRNTPIKGFSDHPLFYIGLSDPLMHPGYLSMIVAVFVIVGVGVGDFVIEGVGVFVDVWEGVTEAVGVLDGVMDGVGELDGVSVGVTEEVTVGVGGNVLEGVDVGIDVEEGVGVTEPVGEGVGVEVGTGVLVGVGVTGATDSVGVGVRVGVVVDVGVVVGVGVTPVL